MVAPKMSVDDSQPDSAPLPVLGLARDAERVVIHRRRLESLGWIALGFSVAGVLAFALCGIGALLSLTVKAVDFSVITALSGVAGIFFALIGYCLGAVAGDVGPSNRAMWMAGWMFAPALVVVDVIALLCLKRR